MKVYFCPHTLVWVTWFEHEPTDDDIARVRQTARDTGLPAISIRWTEPVDGDDEHDELWERHEKL